MQSHYRKISAFFHQHREKIFIMKSGLRSLFRGFFHKVKISSSMKDCIRWVLLKPVFKHAQKEFFWRIRSFLPFEGRSTLVLRINALLLDSSSSSNSNSQAFSAIFLCVLVRFFSIMMEIYLPMRFFQGFFSVFFLLSIPHSTDMRAYLMHDILPPMHHCVVKCSRGLCERLWNAQHKSSFINSPQRCSRVLWWRECSTHSQEQLRFICLRYGWKWNCVPFKRSTQAEGTRAGEKYAKEIILCEMYFVISFVIKKEESEKIIITSSIIKFFRAFFALMLRNEGRITGFLQLPKKIQVQKCKIIIWKLKCEVLNERWLFKVY